MTETSRRQFQEKKLVVASHNPGKLREIKELLLPFQIDVLSSRELELSEPEENGATFIANAQIKALSAMKESGFAALSDDSGLCVEGLDGAPGIYSARWAGPSKDFSVAMQKIENELAAKQIDESKRTAHFACALCLAWPDGHCEDFFGTVEGRLVWPPRGEKGFGYDPMFVPNGFEETFGEIDPSQKHAMSHRAVAFNQLVAECFKA